MKSLQAFWPLGLLAALAGCTMGPDYRAPAPLSLAQFQAPLPAAEGEAARASGLQQWWSQFDEALVGELVAAAEASSPTLDAALARLEQARATAGISGAARYPALDANGSATRARSGSKPVETVSRSLDSSWELDLFGARRKAAEADRSRAAARGSDWHDARVTLAAEVAGNVVRYRACAANASLLEQEVVSRGQTEQMTGQKIKAGFAPQADSFLSAASAADARQRLVAQQAACAVLAKTLVQLTGIGEPALRARLDASQRVPAPRAIVVDTVPAQALMQRPDIAAAEQDLRAAAADINAAEGRRYPTLTLGGSIGVLRLDGSSADTWSFGPALKIPLFDGGARKADAMLARARYAEREADYRGAVRRAVREIEEALVNLDASTRRAGDAEAAARGYERYFKGSEDKFRAGPGSLFELEVARRDALAAQQLSINLQQERVLAWIALYKALGGGWHAAAALPTPST